MKIDGGLQVFKNLHVYLSKYFKPTKTPTLLDFPRGNLSLNFLAPSHHNENFCLQKLKDFKISGSIRGPGQKDNLSHTSLEYQIQNGQESCYSDSEICAGVIKSIAQEIIYNLTLNLKSCQTLK